MKILLRIAKLELNNLFYSPYTWLAMFIFTIFCGTSILPEIEQTALNQGLYGTRFERSLTEWFFTQIPSRSFYHVATTIIIILVPLVVMGTISREAKSGTIKMLFSSPIKLRDIVLGKFLAIMVFVSLLMGIALLNVICGVFTIENSDLGSLVPGFLGLYLLAALVAAVTIYVSTFSAYPVIDVLGTIAFVYGMDLLYNQVKELPVISEIVYWLSPSEQLGYALKGMLLSRTVLYFGVLIVLFLFWAYYKMRLKRQTVKGKRTIRVQMLAVLLVAIGVIYVAIQPQWQLYKDFTRRQSNVLSPLSQKELYFLKDQPITITTYVDMLSSDGLYALNPAAQLKDRESHFYKYQLEFPQINHVYVYYYDEQDVPEYERITGLQGKTLADILAYHCENYHVARELLVPVDQLPEQVRAYRARRTQLPRGRDPGRTFRVLEANGKQALLETKFNGIPQNAQEGDITTAFKRLKTSKLLGFVTGHGELSPYDDGKKGLSTTFSVYEERVAFTNNGFKLVETKLDSPVSAAMDVLVIAHPKEAYSATELKNLQDYIGRGGHLLVMGEAGWEQVINPIITPLGITQLPGMIANDDPQFPPDYNALEIPKKISNASFQTYLQMPTAGALELLPEANGFSQQVLFATDPEHSWIDLGTPNEFGELFYEPEKGEEKASYPLMVQLERNINGATQTIFVASDSDFLTNDRRKNAPSQVKTAGSYRFTKTLEKWLGDGEYPLDIPLPEAKDDHLTIAFENIKYLQLLWYLILPGLFLFFGLKMLRKRMKK